MVWSYGKQNTTVPAFQQILKGFNGEITDTATGWQFLGDGHRTYNPSQRYFFSEDPAGDGYAFGSNNPIMNSDPSGNMPKWLGKVFSLANTVFSLGMSISHNKFCRGIGRSLIWGAMAIPLGPTLMGLSFSVPAALSFASTVKPTNKGLQQASMMTGMIYAGALFVVGIAAIVTGIGTTAGLIGAAEAAGAVAEDPEILLTATIDAFQVIANPLTGYVPAMDELSEVMSSSEELDNSVYESASKLPTGTYDNESLIEDGEEFRAALERINREYLPRVQKAIFGCGRGPDVVCDHEGMTTFSEDLNQMPDFPVNLNQPLEEIMKTVGTNTYDIILQESKGDWSEVAYTALKPGGKFYVIHPGGGNDVDEWFSEYIDLCEDLFPETGVTRYNLEQVFGYKSNDGRFQGVTVFTK